MSEQGAGVNVDLSTQAHLERVVANARSLAVALREAADAGVSNGLILPQLVLVFREEFGEMPAGLTGLLGMAL